MVDGGLKVETFKLFCRANTTKTTTSQPLIGSNSQDYVAQKASINGRQVNQNEGTFAETTLLQNRDQKAHKLFGPHPEHPIWAPNKKVDVPHLLGKDAKKGPT